MAVAALGVAGCNTPSIPIPPPEPGQMAFELDEDAGTATYSYGLQRPDPDFAGAVVYVFNRDQGVGVIDTARDDGSVGPTASFPAALGDEVMVTFELEDQLASTCVVLAAGTPTQVCDP